MSLESDEFKSSQPAQSQHSENPELEALRKKYAANTPKNSPDIDTTGEGDRAKHNTDSPFGPRKRDGIIKLPKGVKAVPDPRTEEDFKPRNPHSWAARLEAAGVPEDIVDLFRIDMRPDPKEERPSPVPRGLPSSVMPPSEGDDSMKSFKEWTESLPPLDTTPSSGLLPKVPGQAPSGPSSGMHSGALNSFPQPQTPAPAKKPLPTAQPGKLLRPMGTGNHPPSATRKTSTSSLTPAQTGTGKQTLVLPKSAQQGAIIPGRGLITPQTDPDVFKDIDPDELRKAVKQSVLDILKGNKVIED